MAEIHFYHLTSTPLERALPKLLEKAQQGGFRSVLLMESEDKVEWINNILWTYDPNSFLPHGSAKDGNADIQPIYITSNDNDNPNHSDLLVVTDGKEHQISTIYRRVIDIFDGMNADEVAKARERWKKYQAEGYKLEYRQQNENGSWVTK
jgi:DNA polymerase-3 subunit chi